ncbi:bifunctional 5,10-methylenetetrahydrofolate dehydrogenase/5,10-methenyltetrahydrofolate cyclohydrolase [Candidatus Parcubacteria bacterium]|jgi:methylenetetrahydrofolate dehydrogenase (NADP+) / methenyltetrahydrofolate cyclohydrolase|nr:bifunctional 5,10-methylenetetrahydrofolate dehydrogenase/5,10-methenyltetrahydrofolate cyclohydrolase [Candidatus Parcubacteria bacterium]
MTEKIIDGKALSLDIQIEIRQEILKNKLKPSLAVILVGEDPASKLYVELKRKACEKVGIDFHEYLLDEDTSQEHILEMITFLNTDKHTDAILIQLPLPKQLDTNKIIQAMNPDKDVDGFHPDNVKNFLEKQSNFIPGLALGIFKLIESTDEDIDGMTAVIVAKSDILYQPLAKLLNDQGVSTTIVRTNDKKIKNKCLQADILVTACGKAFFITADMVKDDAIVIDVGTNKIDNNYVVGDVDYSAVFSKVKHITPVPGGVGPMTVAMLLHNTVQLAKKNK